MDLPEEEVTDLDVEYAQIFGMHPDYPWLARPAVN